MENTEGTRLRGVSELLMWEPAGSHLPFKQTADSRRPNELLQTLSISPDRSLCPQGQEQEQEERARTLLVSRKGPIPKLWTHCRVFEASRRGSDPSGW